MKIRIFLFIFLAFFLLRTENSIGQSACGLKYHITGNVNGKEGTKIALVLDSKGVAHRMVATIRNNRFEFRGESPETESARLFYEDDLLNNDGRLTCVRFFVNGK
jgi:hypothetical protein